MWLLILVTALSPIEFRTEVLSRYELMSECHVGTTEINWEEIMPVNQELLCIRVSEGWSE